MAHELGVAEIRSFLDTAKTSHSLEHKLYKVGSLIFAYGKEQRMLVLNPFDEIDRPKVTYTVPEILEPTFFVIRMLRIGWRVQAKRDWASFPNEWAILRASANGIIWRHSLEKKVRPGSDCGAAPKARREACFDGFCQSCLVCISENSLVVWLKAR